MSDSPEWYDKKRLMRAHYAPGYTGWVVDLEDGTCHLANSPLLGENNLEYGDRVDLFFPIDDETLPFIGYRRYNEKGPVAGEHLGREGRENELLQTSEDEAGESSGTD